MGKMDDAANAFKKATEIDAKYADAFFWLGQALMGKATMTPDGKVVAVPGTIEALENYLKLEPNGKNAETAQALLQTVQGQIQTVYKSEKKKKK
jgi:cytochrome c-type biogenesis protein CcmH/NrfG